MWSMRWSVVVVGVRGKAGLTARVYACVHASTCGRLCRKLCCCSDSCACLSLQSCDCRNPPPQGIFYNFPLISAALPTHSPTNTQTPHILEHGFQAYVCTQESSPGRSPRMAGTGRALSLGGGLRYRRPQLPPAPAQTSWMTCCKRAPPRPRRLARGSYAAWHGC